MPSFFPKLVVFDLDGTLIDYEHDYLFREVLRIFDRFKLEQLSEQILATHHERDDFFGWIECPQQRVTLERVFAEEFREHEKPPARLLPGVLETLDFLASRNVHLAIATARAQLPESIREKLAHTGLLEWIDCIVARPSQKLQWRDKTHQIRVACNHACVAPFDSYMVGDNPSDTTSAHAAGIGGIIAVRTGKVVEELLRKAEPHAIIDSVAEIPSLVRRHEEGNAHVTPSE